MSSPVLTAVAVTAHHPGRRRHPSLLSVDLELQPGTLTALIGRSGAGKTTLAEVLVGARRASTGAVLLDGEAAKAVGGSALRARRRAVQLVPQDPGATLDPRRSIRRSMLTPLRRLRVPGDHERLIAEAVALLRLEEAVLDRRPHECSGGQLQRAALARTVAIGPRVLVADEPTSALDSPLRALVLDHLRAAADRGCAVLLMSHHVTEALARADRVIVLDGGRRVAEGAAEDPAAIAAQHPAAERLLHAAGAMDEGTVLR